MGQPVTGTAKIGACPEDPADGCPGALVAAGGSGRVTLPTGGRVVDEPSSCASGDRVVERTNHRTSAQSGQLCGQYIGQDHTVVSDLPEVPLLQRGPVGGELPGAPRAVDLPEP